MYRLILALAVVAVAAPAAAQQMVQSTITLIRTGWNDDQFAVVTSAPTQNPAHCPTADGYITHKSYPGYQTYLTAALAAFTSRSQVVVTMHNTECGVAGRPKLIGINLMHANNTARTTKAADMTPTINQINDRTDRIERALVALSQMTAREPSGRTLINLVSSIRMKVGAP